MTDFFESYQPGLDSPPASLTAIVPSDSADLPRATRAINVSSAGVVRVTTVNGDEAQVYVAAGIAFPLRARRVWATGTDATGIVGLS
ncbi:hypothetical protein So717_42150 [Roseobacter cerasinus]|uniref:Uncharacterized protein n=1 Tax=Roseobacter cerasinus TaxID=2602289 RepID=A0A640VXQ5_9RHOB|nr:hypothetical protein [Roseobacter cerasinus]GFE52462.1 hypothetical protein So717_42150 [Roseobacter cerasinus]